MRRQKAYIFMSCNLPSITNHMLPTISFTVFSSLKQLLSQPKIIPPLISLIVNSSYLNDISSHHVENNVFEKLLCLVSTEPIIQCLVSRYISFNWQAFPSVLILIPTSFSDDVLSIIIIISFFLLYNLQLLLFFFSIFIIPSRSSSNERLYPFFRLLFYLSQSFCITLVYLTLIFYFFKVMVIFKYRQINPKKQIRTTMGCSNFRGQRIPHDSELCETIRSQVSACLWNSSEKWSIQISF